MKQTMKQEMRQKLMNILLVAALLTVAAGFVGAAPSAAEDGLININTATVDELVQLKGIGPSYAERIVTYREVNGDFKGVEGLLQVKGIGPKTLSANRDQITVGGPAGD